MIPEILLLKNDRLYMAKGMVVLATGLALSSIVLATTHFPSFSTTIPVAAGTTTMVISHRRPINPTCIIISACLHSASFVTDIYILFNNCKFKAKYGAECRNVTSIYSRKCKKFPDANYWIGCFIKASIGLMFTIVLSYRRLLTPTDKTLLACLSTELLFIFFPYYSKAGNLTDLIAEYRSMTANDTKIIHELFDNNLRPLSCFMSYMVAFMNFDYLRVAGLHGNPRLEFLNLNPPLHFGQVAPAG